VVAIFKTRASLAGDVGQAVRDSHSFKLPAVAVIALESVDADYFGWILDETKPDQP
jgi:periplasmic divalent cation tolerance protein